MVQALHRFTNVRRDEAVPVLLAVAYFFCVLTALMVLRPARDALGMQRGIEAVRWLFMGTLAVTLLVNPLFGWLVSRLRRLHFVTTTYAVFAASLFGFYLLMTWAPHRVGVASGQVFYVWFSVFNLFSTMVFWALMADRFSLGQSKRFFALIAAGGTCGAIFGPWLAATLAEPLGTPSLLLVAIAFLALAVLAAWGVARTQPRRAHPGGRAGGGDGLEESPLVNERSIIGGSAWEGLRAVFRSRYLLGMAAFIVTLTLIGTFIYFTRLQMVAALGEGLDLRTTVFARIDLITQVATLVLQVVVAGHLMRRFGVHVALAILPVAVAFGFVGLAVFGSLAALIVLEATFRALQRAIVRPGRETLYTVVSREDKYKSKAFIDTFVYRAGDAVGAQVEGLLGRLGMGLAGLAAVVVPLAIAWAVLSVWLGLEQQRRAEAQHEEQERFESAI